MMPRRVAFSTEARADLGQIFDYLAERSTDAAARAITEIVEAAAGLSESALHYPLVPGRPETAVRRRVVKTYNVFFTADAELVTVIRVLHGARDAGAALFPDDA